MATYLNPAVFLRLPLLTSNGITLEELLTVLSDYSLRILTTDPLLLVSVIVNGTIAYHVLSFLFSKRQIPAFGFPHWLPAGRIYGGARFFVDSFTMLSEGYNASKSTVFKIPRWRSWVYVLSGEELVEEFHRFSDKSLSLLESAKDELQIPYTMGLPVHDDPYHLPILRHKLTRNLNYLVSEILDEAVPAFDAVIGQNCPPGKILRCKGLHSVTTIVAQTFNRILVGPDLCRNVDYNKISIQFAVNTMVTSTIINLFPSFLHPVIGRLTSRFSSNVQKAVSQIGPLVAERRALMSNGVLIKEDMDTDFLWWFLAAAQGEQASTEALVARILVINAATIHTSSMTLTQALISLALHPEWAVRLREEATSAFSRHGWSRDMLKELSAMDCFLKESMRINGLGSMGFPRKAMETLRFSDGTIIPAGCLVSPAFGAHFDSAYYQDPLTFDPMRFMEGTSARKAYAGGMVHTSSHYLPFGHGKHTWLPGRFVASHLLKTFMAHILMNYEISLVDGQRPKDLWFGMHCVPNTSFSFTFRRLCAAPGDEL
ncbi:cytochrome P450 [Desarmillaria tabescens]|uniref:Cytochrome P450 n=1 Tax=Armillaria tabescens TaxID=1929756 RepID=A0AA39NDQ3_ARMTA|nr:cytochrome P450 [Desarmillaria tabescens]KAK0463765.1 cytochrome P450 [Desarmillaria tabescens]